jgi:hypothetical protein
MTEEANDWIEWDGVGGCPVDLDTLVFWQCRHDLARDERVSRPARMLTWSWFPKHPEADIIAYRIDPSKGAKNV